VGAALGSMLGMLFRCRSFVSQHRVATAHGGSSDSSIEHFWRVNSFTGNSFITHLRFLAHSAYTYNCKDLCKNLLNDARICCANHSGKCADRLCVPYCQMTIRHIEGCKTWQRRQGSRPCCEACAYQQGSSSTVQGRESAMWVPVSAA